MRGCIEGGRTALSDRATSQVHLENYSLGLGDIWSACSGLTGQGLSALESHMIYQLRFVLRSYSQDTHEASQEPVRPEGVKTAKTQILERLRRFIRRQDANEDSKLSSMYLPRAQQLETTIGQLKGVGRERAEHQETLLTCNDCGAIFIGTGALRRHSQKQHPHSSSFPKEPKFDPIQHSRTGSAECLACGRAFKSYFFLRKHIEDSTSPQVHTLLRQSSDSLQTDGRQDRNELLQQSLLDPAAATSSALHARLMESCALCGQALAGNKAVKHI